MSSKAALLLALSSLAPAAAADVVVLEPAKDNTLYESVSGHLSNGAGSFVFSGKTADGQVRRALLAFDVAGSVPAGAQIDAVTLTLKVSQTISSPHAIALHRATQDWGEGASDAPAQEGGGAASEPGDATWIHTDYASGFWNNAGGDFAPAASATTTVGSIAFYTWSSPMMVADVQAWLDAPSTAYGWLVKHASESGTATAKRFDSKDNPEVSVRPKLEITYTPGAPCAATSFCSSTPNSTGAAALMGFTGSCVVAANDFTLEAAPVPDQFGIFYYGFSPAGGGAGIPFGNGVRCVGSPGEEVFRLAPVLASGNVLSTDVDLDSPRSVAGQITGGSTWYFQAWFRDPAAGGAAFDLSDGLEVTFQ